MTRRSRAGRALALAVTLAGLLLLLRPAAADTLVLVDVPPTLERALRTSLAPWGIELVISPAEARYAPAEAAAAHQAGFVVWRRGRSLHLYDAALASDEERPLPAADDDAGAAALALSIKTWMGLGPPPGGACGLDDCPRPPPHRWLVELATGLRVAPADLGGAGWRYGLAAGHRRGRLEGGVRVELGPSSAGTAFERDGTWSTLLAGAWLRAELAVAPHLSVLPGVGVGYLHAGFHADRLGPGEQAIDTADGTAYVDAEVGGRWQRGRVAVGARLGLTMAAGTLGFQSKQLEQSVGAHPEPWLLVTASVAL